MKTMTPKTPTHMPTPWKIRKAIDGNHNPVIYLHNEQEEVCEFSSPSPLKFENSAFIVRAVNSHEELLSSLKKITHALEQHILDAAKDKNISRQNLCPCWENELMEAKQALARAEKGE